MIQILLIVHALISVALLGAITHQAFSVSRKKPVAPSRNVVDRFRGVNSMAFTNTVVVLFAVASLAGGLLYPRYRVDVRPSLEDMQLRAANGVFEIKEHFAAVGLGLLAAYWRFWRTPLAPQYQATRTYLTWILAFIVWWSFLIGHVLNNLRGFGP